MLLCSALLRVMITAASVHSNQETIVKPNEVHMHGGEEVGKERNHNDDNDRKLQESPIAMSRSV